MVIDATFWVGVSFILFFAVLIYLKIPQKINEILNNLIANIKNEIDESEKLRAEAKTLLENAQIKLESAQKESKKIINQAKKESENLIIEMNDKFHKSSEIKKNLAKEYYIHLLKNWGVDINGRKVLDIGCGNGGFITAFSEYNCSCTGIEINNFNWKIKDSINILVGDITDSSFNKYISKKYHQIILSDVIEHIPLDSKTIFLESVLSLISKKTKLLLTFPPFYSAFGLH